MVIFNLQLWRTYQSVGVEVYSSFIFEMGDEDNVVKEHELVPQDELADDVLDVIAALLWDCNFQSAKNSKAIQTFIQR